MNLQKAIKILDYHNRFRNVHDLIMLQPKEVTKAIEIVLKELTKNVRKKTK